jgi:hypothetical protein
VIGPWPQAEGLPDISRGLSPDSDRTIPPDCLQKDFPTLKAWQKPSGGRQKTLLPQKGAKGAKKTSRIQSGEFLSEEWGKGIPKTNSPDNNSPDSSPTLRRKSAWQEVRASALGLGEGILRAVLKPG